ncbi:MAG TPA: ComF family protein [Elusimicrobiota bacterium]|nr:ComF family protein [Elusimicrobiota bacterium]
MDSLHRLIAPFLRFLLPWACACCRAALPSLEDEGFCGRCWLSLPRLDGWVCQACGIGLPDGGQFCYGCQHEPTAVPIRAATAYAGVMRAAIWRFKYAGRRTLALPFARLMARSLDLHPQFANIHGIVPVPLHPSAFRQRGYNQAFELAFILGKIIRRPVLDGLLIRHRRTRPSLRLKRTQRQENIRGAFAWGIPADQRRRLKGTSLLLVDDVCTTTSTLAECARVLRESPVAGVRALVLARD